MLEDAATEGPKLTPLACETCGMVIPLGQDTLARCAFCQTARRVPADYVRLRNAARLDAADRAALEAGFAAIRTPTGPIDRFWIATASFTSFAALVVTVVFTLVITVGAFVSDVRLGAGALGRAIAEAIAMLFLSVPVALEHLLHVVGRAGFLGPDLADALGPWSYVAFGCALYALVVLPVVLGDYHYAQGETVAALRRSIAAQPPTTPGGPPRCWSCGAALDVPDGAAGARCVYCKTDNLAKLDPNDLWLETDHAHAPNARLQDALATLQSDRTRLAAARSRSLLRGTLVVPLVVALGLLGHIATENAITPTLLRRAVPDAGQMIPDDPRTPPLTLGATATVTLQSPEAACDDRSGDRCEHYYVALRRGAVFRCDTQGEPLGVTLLQHERGWRSLGGMRPPWHLTDEGERLPYTGWYRVELRGPTGAHPHRFALRCDAR